MNSTQTIYPFKAKLLSGKEKTLSDYKGKVIMVVNTASGCSFTPQLKELQELRDKYADQGFEILGFPSNDFGRQEPLDGAAINEFCEVNYGVKFPVFEKIMVRGSQAHPLFKFLSEKKLNGHINSSPKWNFHKYLINKAGEVVDFFYSFTKPNSSKVKKKIQHLLDEK
ncbi:redoxin domain-containing protein [Pedobacter sp. LMG 31464]|uniref:Glutathione peroxidase n=1 Tax=Pedobacter planticolens TaxID=2679964 RepID=A0A923DZ84_9SPHI|nr:glutathione peroxidase [Pedobacter planticolens]MBB2145508.1 redoxin domain-containing protein [Pedobacter planticolens]